MSAFVMSTCKMNHLIWQLESTQPGENSSIYTDRWFDWRAV